MGPAEVAFSKRGRPMKIKSPIVTLLVGVLIAVVVVILSVHAKHTEPAKPYGSAPVAVVPR